MSREETQASPFAALFQWDRKNGGGGGGRAKVQLEAKESGSKLRIGGRRTERRFHPGHRLAGTKINNVVKVRFVKNNSDAARHIIQHIDYLQKRQRDRDEPERKFYGRNGERSRDDAINAVMKNRGDHAAMFKIILSPKQNELNHIQYATEIMRRFEEMTGIKTDWSMLEHKNTEHHHVHIVMPGRDENGQSFRLEQEHLDMFRELANEYQYELQDIEYLWEKQIEKEFGYGREEAQMLLNRELDRDDMKALGVFQPEVNRVVREELLRPTNFDEVYFAQQLQKQFWENLSQEFKDQQSKTAKQMQEDHPQLFPGVTKRLQAEEINNAYFDKLQEFHPALYREHTNDKTLDRGPVIDRLKQAFPEWHDPIVEDLKQREPKLFANYEKPKPTERQIIDNLRVTDPELFPELSKQIQSYQLNTVAMAILARVNPSRLEQILSESDPARQQALLDKTRQEYSNVIEQAKQQLSERFPKIYQWGKDGPSQTEIIADLVKSNPELFPQAAQEVQRREIDQALFERFRAVNPSLADHIEFNPDMRGAAITWIRYAFPEELKKATELVKEEQPQLFKYDRQGPTEREIIQTLKKEKPDLFPDFIQKLKQEEIDKAYFERGRAEMPDGLSRYVENPDLDRKELHKVLRKSHPEWGTEIEADLKQKRPELFKFANPYPSAEERISELLKTSPKLFPALNMLAKDQLQIERSERLLKLLEVKGHLIDQAYFEKGRGNMADGLVAYLQNTELDRNHVIEGLKLAHPGWRKEILKELRELHPALFNEIGKEENCAFKEAIERERQLKSAGEKDKFNEGAMLLLSNPFGKNDLDKPDSERTDDKDNRDAKEKDRQDRDDRSEELLDSGEEAMRAIKDLKTGKEWAGLMGPLQDPSFVDEPLNLTAQAQALFDSQQNIFKQLNEFNDSVTELDPTLFKLEDMLGDVEEGLDDIERNDNDGSM